MRIAVLAVFALLFVVGSAIALRYLDIEVELDLDNSKYQEAYGLTSDGKARTTAKDGAPDQAKRRASVKTKTKASGDAPSFDVARIDPDGVSVFAGHAKPNQRVSVLADERVVGTAEADGEGNWVLVSEGKVANRDAAIAVKAGVVEAREPARAETLPAVNKVAGSAETVAAVNARMIASLERLIETARESDGKPARESGGRIETGSTVDQGARGDRSQQEVRVAVAEPESANDISSGSQSPTSRDDLTIPIPIQFVYREATFTDEGKRAAKLLLEYLKVSKSKNVALTGHADERGSTELNMELSRARLDTVRAYLRAGGYDGALDLTPKGESEPFTGVDRAQYSRDELFQLDRRVELRLGG